MTWVTNNLLTWLNFQTNLARLATKRERCPPSFKVPLSGFLFVGMSRNRDLDPADASLAFGVPLNQP